MRNTALFLQEFFSCPRQVGAFLPSSRNLARAMALWLPPATDCHVLELGPGTGVVTQALLNRGLQERQLIAIEKSPKMATYLQNRFPKAKIITGDATQLEKLVLPHTRSSKIGIVFSSLPLLNFPPAIAETLLKQIHAVLPPEGKLIQFSYYLGSPQTPIGKHFKYLTSEVVWLNCPPARVSVFEKAADNKSTGFDARPKQKNRAARSLR